jgi:hypothetical protein
MPMKKTTGDIIAFSFSHPKWNAARDNKKTNRIFDWYRTSVKAAPNDDG